MGKTSTVFRGSSDIASEGRQGAIRKTGHFYKTWHVALMKEPLTKMALTMVTAVVLAGFSTVTAYATEKKEKQAATSSGAMRSPSISDAWARATVPGQPVGAAYMKINSATGAVLTAIESDVSPSVQVHSMTHQNGVMQMRKLNKLDIPAGQTVELAPAGNHLMLTGLKKPLKAGESLQLKMTFIDHAGRTVVVPASVPIRPLGQ